MAEPETPSPVRSAPEPPCRRLRVYAFDPSLATRMETAVVNQVTLKVPWDDKIQPGPVDEYVEVIDVDPPSDCVYAPVNLSDPRLIASDGLAPSEGNPQFHQQMVYAVARTTIRNFERALGRRALWSPRYVKRGEVWTPQYVQRLRIYPHALREANAYYSPRRKALLFGYFPADDSDPAKHLPGSMVFTCLSHDVVVHETTHALLDGLHRRFIEPSNPDSLAFHEAFADFCALFQHFSFPEALKQQIDKTGGDLGKQNLLGNLAVQFGEATGLRKALRSAIGTESAPGAYLREREPHARGAYLVAAVFDAFLSIYKARIADLLRIATGGTGRLPEGQLPTDLLNRLANEAAKSAKHVLTMCVRALDYCPPVDLTFGDYLRALITADSDLVRDDDRGYRVAVIEAFRRRGIYPRDVRVLSEESLRWNRPTEDDQNVLRKLLPGRDELRSRAPAWDLGSDRKDVFWALRGLESRIKASIKGKLPGDDELKLLGLSVKEDRGDFEVHSVRPARRIGPDGEQVLELVLEIAQKRPVFLDMEDPADTEEAWKRRDKRRDKDADFWFRGGCTLLINPVKGRVRYVVSKRIDDDPRLRRQAAYAAAAGRSARSNYFGPPRRLEEAEAFAMLHRGDVGNPDE